MSSWRPKQAPAKFRGVPFFVDTGERAGGRQVVEHEYPFSESPAYTEDLGLKGREFSVEGYVLGTEYEAARDALISELEKPGPGELVHPYFGTRRVAVKNFRVRQSRSDGGVAQFTMEFRETSSAAAAPTSVLDSAAAVALKVATARSAASAAYVNTHSKHTMVNGIEGVISASELGLLQSFDLAVLAIINGAPISGIDRAAFDRQQPDPVGYTYVSEFYAYLVGAIFDMTITALTGVSALVNPSGLLLGIYDFNPGSRPPVTTPNRIVERSDFDAAHYLVQRLAITSAATAILAQTFVTYEEAVIARNAITAKIDAHVEAVTDDLFPVLTDLRSALVQAIPGADTDLPHLQPYTPPATVPSLVLAHRLYGNVDREEDLIRRNGVRHPGFITGGEALQVLTNG